jgi:all-trans-8'-apo-beta-carotenal 15,15'-oxygenase
MLTSSSASPTTPFTPPIAPAPERIAAPATVAPPPRSELRQRLFTRTITRQHGFESLRVEGTLPPGLRGTMLRNGPGQFGQFGRVYPHSFEGDGLITAVRLAGDGTAAGAARLTASAGLAAEAAAGKNLFGSVVGWPRRVGNTLRGRGKNTANTNVITWQGRVFALMEAARPTELALTAADITTLGEQDLGGVVGPAMSAHPHRVAARRTTYNFGLRYGKQTTLLVYALPDEGPAARLAELPLPFAPMLHDFIATERHLVWFLSPAALSVPRMLLQLGDFTQLFRWRPELGTEVIVMPIDAPTEVTRFSVEAFYQWHFANAFERGGELVIDYVRYPNFDTFTALGQGAERGEFQVGRLHRAVVTPGAKALRSEPLLDEGVEFPRVHPGHEGRAHGVTWMASADADAVLALDARGQVRRARFGADELVSEAVLVPRPGDGAREDDGWLLALVYRGGTDSSYLAVLDAARLEDGPVARVHFDHEIPVTFHGNWLPA